MEIRELSEIVKEEDEHAFTVVLEASEVFGRFRHPAVFQKLQRLQAWNRDEHYSPPD